MKNAEIISDLFKVQRILVIWGCDTSHPESDLYCTLAARNIQDALENINKTIRMLAKEKGNGAADAKQTDEFSDLPF